MVNGHCLVHLDHHGVVHPHDADEVPVAIRQVHRVHLELLVRPVKVNVDHEIALHQSAGDVGRIEGPETCAEVEDEAVLLPGPNKHGNVHTGSVWVGVVNVNNSNTGSLVLVAEGAPGVVVLARGAQERPVAGALVLAPQIRAVSLALARIGVALGFAKATGDSVDLFDIPADSNLEVFFCDLHVIDGDVLDAPGKRGSIVGQDLLVSHDPTQEGVVEHGVVLAGRVNGLSSLEGGKTN